MAAGRDPGDRPVTGAARPAGLREPRARSAGVPRSLPPWLWGLEEEGPNSSLLPLSGSCCLSLPAQRRFGMERLAGQVGCRDGLAWVLVLARAEKSELRPKYAPGPRRSSRKHSARVWVLRARPWAGCRVSAGAGTAWHPGIVGSPAWKGRYPPPCAPTAPRGRERGDEARLLRTAVPVPPYLRGSWMPG